MMTGMEKWKGKIALVTGASSGMGAETARHLARHGMRVALAARRKERLEAQAREIGQAGGEALAIPTDLRDERSILAMFETLRETWGALDVLINNAGLGWENTLPEGSTEEWREMLDVNVLALSVCMREAIRQMRGKQDAQIVNVASSTARRVPAGKKLAFYAATKYAVRALTDGLRDELMLEGSPIRVSMISPGLTATGFHERFYRDAGRARENYAKFNPLRPSDVAETICFVLSAPRHVVFDDVIFRSLGQVY
jgi:NADP-dependent 3-hydroxy acid dehydrogenase YdfG